MVNPKDKQRERLAFQMQELVTLVAAAEGYHQQGLVSGLDVRFLKIVKILTLCLYDELFFDTAISRFNAFILKVALVISNTFGMDAIARVAFTAQKGWSPCEEAILKQRQTEIN